jgi:hypothetical protein
MNKEDKNHRPIECETCDQTASPTILTAWASNWLLEREGVSSIQELDDDDLRRLANVCNKDCAIEGHCLPCNGPDDGDDGNQDD